jgi:hypothetical protein
MQPKCLDMPVQTLSLSLSMCVFLCICTPVRICLYVHLRALGPKIIYWLEDIYFWGSCVTLYNFLLIDFQVFLDLAEKDMKQINALFREVI